MTDSNENFGARVTGIKKENDNNNDDGMLVLH